MRGFPEFPMRRLNLAIAVVLAAGLAHADSPPMPGDAEAKWKAEIEEANAAYAKKPTAILKIDDAIYLKPGERAWLIHATGRMAWTLKAPAQPSPVVAFSADGKSGTYSDKE